MTEFDGVKNSINVLLEDTTTPKSVREKLTIIVHYLDSEEDLQKKTSKVLSELDEMSADINIPPYVRTQLFTISSELEALNN